MEQFFYDLGDKIETFFATDTAAILGAALVVTTVVFVLLLLKIFEKK